MAATSSARPRAATHPPTPAPAGAGCGALPGTSPPAPGGPPPRAGGPPPPPRRLEPPEAILLPPPPRSTLRFVLMIIFIGRVVSFIESAEMVWVMSPIVTNGSSSASSSG